MWMDEYIIALQEKGKQQHKCFSLKINSLSSKSGNSISGKSGKN